jgi:hypothetical protein
LAKIRFLLPKKEREMYVNKVAPEVGDVVADPRGLGDVLKVAPNQADDYVYVTVQWRTRGAQIPSPLPIPAKSLTFIRRK